MTIYYGIRVGGKYWLKDGNGTVLWFPCREIAEAQREAATWLPLGFRSDELEVAPFNESPVDREAVRKEFYDRHTRI